MQSGEVASPSLDDRNMFQRYGFQFGSIGNFGRDVSSVQATPTGSEGGSWGRPVVRYNGGGSTAGLPVAVFRFQDFDDMVARMRDETASQANTDRQRDVSHHHHHQQQQQQQQQQLQKDWRGTPLHTSVDYEVCKAVTTRTDFPVRDVVRSFRASFSDTSDDAFEFLG